MYIFKCSRCGKNGSLDWLLLLPPPVYFEILFSSSSQVLRPHSVSSDRSHQSRSWGQTNRLFSACGTRVCFFLALYVLSGLWQPLQLEFYRESLVLLLVRTGISSRVLQSLNFDKEHLVSKEIIGLPNKEFLPPLAYGGKGLKVLVFQEVPPWSVFCCCVNKEFIGKKPRPSNIDWDLEQLRHSELFRAYSNFFLNRSLRYFRKTQRKIALMFWNTDIHHCQGGLSNCDREKRGNFEQAAAEFTGSLSVVPQNTPSCCSKRRFRSTAKISLMVIVTNWSQ